MNTFLTQDGTPSVFPKDEYGDLLCSIQPNINPASVRFVWHARLFRLRQPDVGAYYKWRNYHDMGTVTSCLQMSLHLFRRIWDHHWGFSTEYQMSSNPRKFIPTTWERDYCTLGPWFAIVCSHLSEPHLCLLDPATPPPSTEKLPNWCYSFYLHFSSCSLLQFRTFQYGWLKLVDP